MRATTLISRCLSLSALAALLALTALARADERAVIVQPVQVEPVPEGAPVDLEPLARVLDGVLREAVQDYGLHLASEPALMPGSDEEQLVRAASRAWVISPSLGLRQGELDLRIAAVAPRSQVLWVRRERITADQAEVRALGLLRELLEPRIVPAEAKPEPVLASAPPPADSRSDGRAVLALHTAALGGYLGFSLQRTSGSDDARLTYPLAALGAGVGLGSAMIVADEWDIDVGRAWYLGAGMVWPGVATLLLVDPADSDESGPRHLLGIAGALGGVTLATAGLALGDVDTGGAAMTHSGAALGLLLGGLGEMIVLGDAEAKPKRGLGVGALIGVVAAGAAASQFQAPSATDCLFVDLSALLGGLAGAALGTPLLVSQDPGPTRDRLWLSAVMVGTLTGAGLGVWFSGADGAGPATPGEPANDAAATDTSLRIEPRLGWAGHPLGFGLSGSW